MTEIIVQIYNYADRAICSIPDGWPYKMLMGILFITLSKHVMLFTAFAAAVAIDLFAKFIALSYHWLVENKVENPSLLDAIRGIPAAHRARVINSHEMKTQFAGKIAVYMILITAGGLVDYMVGHSNFAQIVIAYLASTELLSIVENLDDAGVSAVHDLATLIKKRRPT